MIEEEGVRMPEAPVYSAIPEIHLNGEPVAMDGRLIERVIIEGRRQSTHLDIRFALRSSRRLDPVPALDFGAELKVPAPQDGPTLFAGRVCGRRHHYPQDSAPSVTISAVDTLGRLRSERRTRVFENLTDADIITNVVESHGLIASVEVGFQLAVHRQVVQSNQDDAEFLMERARRHDLSFALEEDTVVVRPISNDPHAGVLTLGNELKAFDVSAHLREQVSSLTVHGWQPSTKLALHAVGNLGAIVDDIDSL